MKVFRRVYERNPHSEEYKRIKEIQKIYVKTHFNINNEIKRVLRTSVIEKALDLSSAAS